MARTHRYSATVEWTGNRDVGTLAASAYSRDHDIRMPGKPVIRGSSDPAFQGDRTRHNPEDLLIAALSACHMLWYLHLCSLEGIVVMSYVDDAEAEMIEEPRGGGKFVRTVLRPRIVLAPDSDAERAKVLHRQAHANCFIANSVNFPIETEPSISVA